MLFRRPPHGETELEVIEGSLNITADGKCVSMTRFKPVAGNEIRREVNAAYTQDGNRVTMRDSIVQVADSHPLLLVCNHRKTHL